MDHEFSAAMSLLPPMLQTPLLLLSEPLTREVTEIRLRVGCPPFVRVRGREQEVPNAPLLTKTEAETFFLRLCGGAVYAHRDEIAAGFLTVNGIRVGLCGHAVAQNGGILSLDEPNAFVIRVARRHEGIARPLLPYLQSETGFHSTLLFGPPLSGKTTLLRDLASAAASLGTTTAVIDERCELFCTSAPCLDVFAGYPRAAGVEQAVRLFSPALIVFDELGREEDVRCLRLAAGTGASVFATAHAENFAALQKRELLSDALRGGFFTRFVGLDAGEHVGQITGIYGEEGEKLESDRADLCYGGLSDAGQEQGERLCRTGTLPFRFLHVSPHGA